jgi:site-specific recombinase XerD
VRNSNFRNSVWRPALLAAGAPEGLHVHDLRHTAASLAISAGASIKAVQRMLGHAAVAMTLDRYGHLYEEDLETLADRMDSAYRDAASVVALRPVLSR